MNFGILRFSKHCNRGFHSPPDVILHYVVTGSTCCKGTRSAFVFMKGSASLYIQHICVIMFCALICKDIILLLWNVRSVVL